MVDAQYCVGALYMTGGPNLLPDYERHINGWPQQQKTIVSMHRIV